MHMNIDRLNEIAQEVAVNCQKDDVVKDALAGTAYSLAISLSPATKKTQPSWNFSITTSKAGFKLEHEEFDGEQIALLIKDELDRALPDDMPKEEQMLILDLAFSLSLNGRKLFPQD
jgi:hypothetical protein